MDSPKEAIKYILLYLPLKATFRVAEWFGTVYALYEYPFQKGKRKVKKTYDNLKL